MSAGPAARQVAHPEPPVPGRDRGVPLAAITFDFGNTLVPVTRAALALVVELCAEDVAARSGPFDLAAFHAAWARERERQFAEETVDFREVDMRRRFVRVLACLRGAVAPPPGQPWDDAAAAARSDPGEIEDAVAAYSRAFVGAIPAPAGVGAMLRRLARRYRLAVLSNWPLAATIDRYVEAAGWAPSLAAVVVSERVGRIKPHSIIYEAAAAAIGVPSGPAILHVGDDWEADVAGALAQGWRAAYLVDRPADSPLPSHERVAGPVPDLEIEGILELEGAIEAAPWSRRP